jgi:hypothetical protein
VVRTRPLGSRARPYQCVVGSEAVGLIGLDASVPNKHWRLVRPLRAWQFAVSQRPVRMTACLGTPFESSQVHQALSNWKISLRLTKGPQLAGFDIGVSVSAETFSRVGGDFGLAVSAPGNPISRKCSSAAGRFRCRYRDRAIEPTRRNRAPGAGATIRRAARRAEPRPSRETESSMAALTRCELPPG